MNDPIFDSMYVTSIEEILWALLLTALIIGIHAYGMLGVIRSDRFLGMKFGESSHINLSVFRIMISACGIILTHLVEVMIWGLFLYLQNITSNVSMGFYVALMDYTTLGSDYSVPKQWRLMEGMMAISGLLTFAWSTGVLFGIVNSFHARHTKAR